MTPWTVAHQAPLSMAFSRQEHRSWFPCPPPGDLPNSGMEPRSPALQADSLPSELPGRPQGPLLVNQKGLECFHWYEVQLFLLGCPPAIPSAAPLPVSPELPSWIWGHPHSPPRQSRGQSLPTHLPLCPVPLLHTTTCDIEEDYPEGFRTAQGNDMVRVGGC